MNAVVREWLPREALTPERIGASLSGAVGQWTERWFSRAVAEISLCRDRTRSQIGAPEQMHAEGRVVSVTVSGRGKRYLLEAALGETLAEKALNTADHRLLDAFAQCILEDLAALVDTSLGDASCSHAGAPVQLTLALADKAIGFIACAEEALIPLIKGQLDGPAESIAIPTGRLAALGHVRIEVEALLGRVELPVEDLEGLAVGDVLILNRKLQAPVELFVTGESWPLGSGRLGHEGDRCTISF